MGYNDFRHQFLVFLQFSYIIYNLIKLTYWFQFLHYRDMRMTLVLRNYLIEKITLNIFVYGIVL